MTDQQRPRETRLLNKEIFNDPSDSCLAGSNKEADMIAEWDRIELVETIQKLDADNFSLAQQLDQSTFENIYVARALTTVGEENAQLKKQVEQAKEHIQRWAKQCAEAEGLLEQLKAQLKQAATVVWICDHTPNGGLKTLHFVQPVDTTHRALLINIEKIEPKVCEHEPKYIDQSYKLADLIVCKHCGIKLKATWIPDEPR